MEISYSSWPWHRSDATALAGYANMMMMMNATRSIDRLQNAVDCFQCQCLSFPILTQFSYQTNQRTDTSRQNNKKLTYFAKQRALGEMHLGCPYTRTSTQSNNGCEQEKHADCYTACFFLFDNNCCCLISFIFIAYCVCVCLPCIHVSLC